MFTLHAVNKSESSDTFLFMYTKIIVIHSMSVYLDYRLWNHMLGLESLILPPLTAGDRLPQLFVPQFPHL